MKKYQGRYYICLLDGSPVGYIGTNAQDYISIAAISGARGKGLRKFMLSCFHKQMKDRKLRAIVNISNEASLRLFESCGFVKSIIFLKENNMTDMEIIDKIQEIRSRNNVNWMDILRLAFREAPEEARVLMGKVNDYDGEIASLLKKLADNGN